ncbi:hypothetical protein GQ43DRAFT_385059 [Delitschia confertaspora ATCC 74209]|uniref:Wings apart-like protein C-terminal domain-containing protein n=1 Tax=Delitschia confertaspora ATCC 74209 TaxID=1513339 RepID=A0A9P4JWN6_9PLEO|nr:hypothetical protein GQ43DRAFT_385059 [Delitschia confertaspora ATCC 74209]
MATSMSSSLTGTNRRKRIATYGKSSRISSTFNILEESPSPERPRKQVGGLGHGALKKPTIGVASAESLATSRASRAKSSNETSSRDVFDMLSEDDDELASRSGPTLSKKPPARPVAQRDEFDVPSSDEEVRLVKLQKKKAPQLSSKLAPERRQAPVSKKTGKLTDPSNVISSDDPLAARISATKATHASQKPDTGNRQPSTTAKRPPVKPKPASRATTPAPRTATQKRNNSAKVPPSKALSRQKTAPEVDIFDVPSSGEEEATKPAAKKSRSVLGSREKTPVAPRSAGIQSPPGQITESDDSITKKRKRQDSRQASLETTAKNAKIGSSSSGAPQRSNKARKTDTSGSPRLHATVEVQMQKGNLKPVTKSRPTEPVIHKPRRTTARTIPVTMKSAASTTRPALPKGFSSGRLHGLLAKRDSASFTQRSPVPQIPSSDIIEDETMYDVQEPVTPARRKSGASTSFLKGSITPRQKEMFGNLLGDSTELETPGMLNFGGLKLSERKETGVKPSLTRSQTDVPLVTSARKPKLIDTLLQAAPISDEEDASEESSEDDSTGVPEEPTPVAVKKSYGRKRAGSSNATDSMDVDTNLDSGSQASQNMLHTHGGPRITYAKQRSYREEENFEDALLLSLPTDMDVSPFRAFGQRKAQPAEEDDEDDATNKVKGIHELRKKGQDYRFKFETQALLDDIADKNKSARSKRRSSMLELCRHMLDDKFIGQFFDSALEQQLFKNLGSVGEPIFDFAVAFAVTQIIRTEPGFSVLDQIYHSDAMDTLTSLLTSDADIDRIAKDRSTNLSRTGREDVAAFRKLVVDELWSDEKPAKLSPQRVAMKTLELLVLGLRKAGSSEVLLKEEAVVKLLDITGPPCERLRSETATASDLEILDLAFSIMESLSCSKERPVTWSNTLLRRLAETVPILFEAEGPSPVNLAIRLSTNLTNNKPKACGIFAGPGFVQPLVGLINQRFAILYEASEEGERTVALECLILCLGAMINLTEYSDMARISVCKDNDTLINALVQTFLGGLDRASQADSLEESESGVATGYLAVLLGNFCLNKDVRSKIRSRLPRQDIDVLINAVQEFILYNQKVDQLRAEFEGDEGKETWRNFTIRLQAVVERLRRTEN